MQTKNYLENFLNDLINQIKRRGGHAHKNNALRTIHGTAIEGEPFDYEFFGKNKVFCFDAKETNSHKIYFSSFLANPSNRKQFNNLASLKIHSPEYTVCGFLVHFKKFDRVVFFDIDLFSNQTSAYLTPDDGEDFDFQQLFSACICS